MPVPHLSPFGAPLYSNSSAVPASVATLAALKALDEDSPARVHGNHVFVDATGQTFYWHSTCALTADSILVVAADDAPAAGRWLLAPGQNKIVIPFTYATADAAALLTFQAGARFQLREANWKITTGFTGGSSSAIGVSSGTVSGATTKGDILGGASGDVAATLVATGPSNFIAGTAGATMDTIAHIRTKTFVAGDTVRFDRITSAFTAGAGEIHLLGFLALNAGA